MTMTSSPQKLTEEGQGAPTHAADEHAPSQLAVQPSAPSHAPHRRSSHLTGGVDHQVGPPGAGGGDPSSDTDLDGGSGSIRLMGYNYFD
jgi:hypothetical protein